MRLLKDSMDTSLFGDVRFNRETHELLSDSYPWLKTLRRKLREPRLFCYRHKMSGNTMLAMWTHQTKSGSLRLFHEIEMLRKEPNEVWPFDLVPEVLLGLIRPMEESWKMQKDRLKAKQYAEAKLVADCIQERKEVCAYLRSQGLSDEATMIEEGRTSWEPSCTNPDEHAAFVSQLRKSVSYYYGD